MSDLTIRRYEPTDADAVWDLHERVLRDIDAYDEAYAHLDADLRTVEDAYLDRGGEFLVGGRDGTLVAMGATQPTAAVDHHETDPDAAVVRRMRVAPDHQRRGYGTAILRELEARAAGSGVERLVLDTTPDQKNAVALYESFGYTETRREAAPAGEMIFYEKDL